MDKLRSFRPHWTPLRDWRFSTKLVAAMLLLALLPVLIIGTVSQRTLGASLTTAQEGALVNEGNGLTDQAESLLTKNLALVQLAATNDLIVTFASGGPEGNPRYHDLAQTQLHTLLQSDPTFEVAGLINTDGEWYLDQTAQNVATMVPTKVDGRDYFQGAKGGKAVVSDVQAAETAKTASVFFAAPVRDENNTIISVLVVRTNTAALQDIVNKRAAGHEALLVDNEGVVLLASGNNQRYQYHSVAPLSTAQQDAMARAKRFGPDVKSVQPLDNRGLADAFARGPRLDSFSFTLGGAAYYASMQPVASTSWRIITAVPASAFTGPVNTQTRNNLGLGLLLVIVAVAAALAFARQFTRPLGALGVAAARIAGGDYDVRAAVDTHDEIGQVAATVNTMVDQITTAARRQEAENTSMQRQIVKLLEEVSTVAEGDLTVEAEVSADALGAVADSFNYMIGELRQIIGRVNDATRQVSRSTDEILATTSELASEAEQQSARIGDTSAAVEEMALSIQQVSENATVSAQVAREARSSAEVGGRAVAATVEGMGRIREQVQETSKKIKRLGESSQEIGTIVALIQDVADRTELLALNAAIQAAMAGEHGKGFAVVAEEVRRLAERTGEASKQIGALVKGIQAETAEAVAAMEDGTREVVTGSHLADEAGQSLQAIDAIVAQLAELIEAISFAAEQQARASAGIAQAMSEISAVTQHTTAGAELASTSVAGLATLANDLRSSVAAFRLGREVHEAAYTTGAGNGAADPHANGAAAGYAVAANGHR
ncbi:MAG TPA: methyl-accepting chemotaxis protein [Thermomicrobiales bacterium]|nr:methyl-accepting chemotaxis protein [Thermomicrobiales bacterium]